MWFACGIVKLGRLTDDESYIKRGKAIYDYVRSLSSDFGWVPEYAQWHPVEEEHCETCCIRDMIVCADELIKCGYTEYWNDMNLFARNQLMENQVRYSGYVECDDSRPDSDGITYHDIDKRMIGGFTGGSEPNSISLTRFRSIAGCCVGTAPVALKTVWDDAITDDDGILTVNIPCDKETDEIKMESFIPNEGRIRLTAKKSCAVGFRIYDWMRDYTAYLNGKEIDGASAQMNKDDVLELKFDISTVEKKENVRGIDFTVFWRGCDVVDLMPRGAHVRLYQRDLSKPKYYPTPVDVGYTGAANYGPTQQKK